MQVSDILREADSELASTARISRRDTVSRAMHMTGSLEKRNSTSSSDHDQLTAALSCVRPQTALPLAHVAATTMCEIAGGQRSCVHCKQLQDREVAMDPNMDIETMLLYFSVCKRLPNLSEEQKQALLNDPHFQRRWVTLETGEVRQRLNNSPFVSSEEVRWE